jgi:hypothetical protein
MVGEERVVVSDVPGTTRDAIDVRVEHAGERSCSSIRPGCGARAPHAGGARGAR